MKSINQLAYERAKRDLGLMEITGKRHNETIILAHKCTTYNASSDETPWCSSIMNMWMIEACIIRNPIKAKAMLEENEFPSKVIAELYRKAGITINGTVAQNTSANIIYPPTFSAAAVSWAKWGHSVKDAPQEGDVVIYKRSGGHHVHFFREFRKLKTMIYGLGGNQSNTVNYANYFRSNLLDIRRAKV